MLLLLNEDFNPLNVTIYFKRNEILKLRISTFSPHCIFMCFVWISEQTAIISLYNIN
jgi:hypothetical protein